MAEIRITKSKYDNVVSELNNIQTVLEESIGDLASSADDLELLQSGRSIDYQVTKLQDTKSELENFTAGEVANMIEVMDSLITVIEDNLMPKSDSSVIELDTTKIKSSLNKTLDVFAANSSELKSIVEDSSTFEQAIKARHDELDDGWGEAILNPIDEVKQGKAENVFRANETVMDNINVYLAEELTFKNELDALEELIETFDNFGDVFDPFLQSLGNITLYDSFMNNRMNVAHASSSIDAITPEEYENDYVLLNAIHKALDLAGLWPGIIGMVCDVINGVIYLIEWAFFGRDTFDDVLYSVIGLIPGGKVGFSKAVEEAREIGFNPVKLIGNLSVDDIDIKFVEEMLLNLGSAASGAFTNGDGWDVGISMADNIESWISVFAAGLKGV